MRIHGTTRKRPRIVFEEAEKAFFLPRQQGRFDVPKWGSATVHPDHHIRFGNALYSLPTEYIGKEVDIRADSKLMRIYHQGAVIKTRPLVSEGKRSTDYGDYPKHKTAYAMRNCDYNLSKAHEVGDICGAFMEQLLSGGFPWSKLRQAQKFLRLPEKYGTAKVEQACSRALSFSLIDVFSLEFINRKENVLICGPVGVGKTFIANAFAHNAHQLIIEGESYRRKKEPQKRRKAQG